MPGLAVNVTCALCVGAGAWIALSGSRRTVAAALPRPTPQDVQLALEAPAGAAWLELRADYGDGTNCTWRIELGEEVGAREVRRLTFRVGT